jgi:tetratricopeptide (TPR) repeat protein
MSVTQSTFRVAAWRLAQRGRSFSDLTAMNRRNLVVQWTQFVVGTSAIVVATIWSAGAPRPYLSTIPALLAIFVFGSAHRWVWLLVTTSICLGFGVPAGWAGAAIAVGLVHRWTERREVRTGTPRPLWAWVPWYLVATAGLRRSVLLWYALRRLHRGERDSAEQLLIFLVQRPPKFGGRALLAGAHLGLATLARERADVTAGLDHVDTGMALRGIRRSRPLTARLSLERGLLLHEAARPVEAAAELAAAAKKLWRCGDRVGAVVAYTAQAATLVERDASAALEIAVLARKRVTRTTDLMGVIRTELLLAQTAAASGEANLATDAAQSALSMAESTADSYVTAGVEVRTAMNSQAEIQGMAHLVLARLCREAGEYDEALQHARDAVRLCDVSGLTYQAAEAESIMAGIHQLEDHNGSALRHVLAAVAHLDRSRYLLPSPRWRAEWVRSHEQTYDNALRLATAAGDGRLVAELIERARLQAIPRAVGAQASGRTFPVQTPPGLGTGPKHRSSTERERFRSPDGESIRAAAAQAALGADPLQPSPIVTIEGRSLLPRMEVTSTHLRVDLSEQTTLLAGRNALWWGGAIADGHYYWAVLADGRFTCGSTSLTRGTPAADALVELLAVTPGPASGPQDPSSVLAGPLSGRVVGPEDPRSRERDFAWRLSRAFLPGRLSDRLAATMRGGGGPERLVVSLPAALSRLPVALLPLEAPVPGAQTDVPRLVEAASINYAPSLGLLAAIATRAPEPPPSADQPWPVLISVVDPTDDLPHADTGGTPQVLLTGWERLRAGQVDQHAWPATKEQLMDALQRLPQRAGLLAFSGHAHPGHPDAPSTGGLVLARPADTTDTTSRTTSADRSGEDQLLMARELLSPNAQTAALRFPARVLLSACSTSGYGTTPQEPGLAGEWLGVAAAVLFAGADEVIATLFDVVDLPATKRFERRLASELTTASNAAAALRHLQVAALSEWRAGKRMPPLVWAAYACLGGREASGPQGPAGESPAIALRH